MTCITCGEPVSETSYSQWCEVCADNVVECDSFSCNNQFYNQNQFVYHDENFCSNDCLIDTYGCDDCGELECTCDDDSRNERQLILPTSYIPCFLPNRAFGVELETDIVLPCPNGWKRVNDRSVNGKEYIFGPALGLDGVNGIIAGCNILNVKGAVNESCGYHLHMNARDLSEQQILNWLRFCKHFEKDFYSLVPKSRIKSNYCCPINSEILATGDLETFIYGDYKEGKSNKYHESRYVWCNIHSYYYRGTIEIRLHSGTTDPEKVIRWIEFWLHLLEYVTTSNWKKEVQNGATLFDVCYSAFIRHSTVEFYKQRYAKFSKKITKSLISYYEDQNA